MAPSTDDIMRTIAEFVVRDVAQRTGFPTVVTMGRLDDLVVVVPERYRPPDVADPRYDQLLRQAADLERTHPFPVPVFAVALVLPEQAIAYLQHRADPAPQTLQVGPDPHDDPDTRRTVSAGLAELMQAATANPPRPRPAGRAFGAGPGPAANGRRPHPFPAWPPGQGPNGRRGPHR